MNAPVIKAHGSSDARAIMNAIRQAVAYCQTNIIDELRTSFEAIDATSNPQNKPE